jgi:uncharacterized protein (TIGR03086 family)
MHMTDIDSSRFSTAVDGFTARVAHVGADDLSRATPCTDWDVSALVNHVIGEMLWMPPLLEGKTIADVGNRFDGDQVGSDADASWSAAATPATRAVASSAGGETVHLSYGDVTADSYVADVTVDVLVHTWDLARALGADDRLDPQLVDFALQRVQEHADELAGSGMFAPAVSVSRDTDPQTRLLALVGRAS